MKTNLEGTLHTRLGDVLYAITSADHVCIRTESGSVAPITLRGIKYNVNLHLYASPKGWLPKDHNSLYMNRVPGDPKYNTAPSQSARHTVLREIKSIWEAYIAGFSTLPGLARRADLSGQIVNLESEIAELTEKLNAKNAQLNQLGSDLLAAGGPLPD